MEFEEDIWTILESVEGVYSSFDDGGDINSGDNQFVQIDESRIRYVELLN